MGALCVIAISNDATDKLSLVEQWFGNQIFRQ
jgi:hypothetical protein